MAATPFHSRCIFWCKLTFLCIFFQLIILSCKEKIQPEETISAEIMPLSEEVELPDTDSLLFDSLINLPVKISPLYQPLRYNSAAVKSFSDIAAATHGKVYFTMSAKNVVKKIDEVIEEHTVNNSDILFLIDKTGSMEDDLYELKLGIMQVIDAIKNYNNVRIAFAFYGDKNADLNEWFSYKSCEGNIDEARIVINGMKVTGGGDEPESVYDGFFQALKMKFWRSDSKRMIILVGDAPPLEDSLLTEYKLTDLISESQKGNIVMNFYPVIVTPDANPKVIAYKQKDLISNIMPNPTHGTITIQFSDDDEKQMEILTSTGALLHKEKIKGTSWNGSISQLPAGLLVIRISNKKMEYENQKVVLLK